MNRILPLFFLLFFYISLVSAQSKDTVRVMVYNLLNYPDGSNSCSNNTIISGRQDTLKKIIDYIQPDVLMVCELQHGPGGISILNSALNTDGKSNYAMAPFIPNNSGASNLNNGFYYNVDQFSMNENTLHKTTLRDIGRYQLQYKATSSNGQAIYIDFLLGHLKAGSFDEAARARACDTIRKYIDTAVFERNMIVGGDFNMYNGYESGMQTLTSGIYPLQDPINMLGAWHNNSGASYMLTQSTRSSATINCGTYGGMDDRFDLMLTSNTIMTGQKGVRYIPGSYDAVGNNGSTYNDDINASWNSTNVPRSILNAMYYMSDHLPVIMDIEIDADPSVSIQKINQELDVTLFPNPVDQWLQVYINTTSTSDIHIDLTNLMGEKLKHRSFSALQGQQMLSMDLSDLSAGVYLLNVRTGDRLLVKKVIKGS